MQKLETFGSLATARRLKDVLKREPWEIKSKINRRTIGDSGTEFKIYDIIVANKDSAIAKRVRDNVFWKNLK